MEREAILEQQSLSVSKQFRAARMETFSNEIFTYCFYLFFIFFLMKFEENSSIKEQTRWIVWIDRGHRTKKGGFEDRQQKKNSNSSSISSFLPSSR